MISRPRPRLNSHTATPPLFASVYLISGRVVDVMPFPKILLKKRLWVGVVAAVLFVGVYVYVQFVKVRRRLYMYAPLETWKIRNCP